MSKKSNSSFKKQARRRLAESADEAQQAAQREQLVAIQREVASRVYSQAAAAVLLGAPEGEFPAEELVALARCSMPAALCFMHGTGIITLPTPAEQPEANDAAGEPLDVEFEDVAQEVPVGIGTCCPVAPEIIEG